MSNEERLVLGLYLFMHTYMSAKLIVNMLCPFIEIEYMESCLLLMGRNQAQ